MTYELEIPQELEVVQPVFHISILKKFSADPSLIVQTDNVGIKDNLPYKEVSVQILDWYVCNINKKEVASIKVFWMN